MFRNGNFCRVLDVKGVELEQFKRVLSLYEGVSYLSSGGRVLHCYIVFIEERVCFLE